MTKPVDRTGTPTHLDEQRVAIVAKLVCIVLHLNWAAIVAAMESMSHYGVGAAALRKVAKTERGWTSVTVISNAESETSSESSFWTNFKVNAKHNGEICCANLSRLVACLSSKRGCQMSRQFDFDSLGTTFVK